MISHRVVFHPRAPQGVPVKVITKFNAVKRQIWEVVPFTFVNVDELLCPWVIPQRPVRVPLDTGDHNASSH